MDRVPLVSTSLRSAGYDAESKTLEVEFVEGGAYRYFNVPQKLFDGLLIAESKGRFYVAEIRNNYEFEKIES